MVLSPKKVDSSANDAKGTEKKVDKPDNSQKIASSVESVKNEYANLKVGILIAGFRYEQFAGNDEYTLFFGPLVTSSSYIFVFILIFSFL